MNEVVERALNEWNNLPSRNHEAFLAFSRKMYMAANMGVISREELRMIKEAIAKQKKENTLRAMRRDINIVIDRF